MAMQSVPSSAAKLKSKHIRLKHQKVKLFRANEPLLSVFMWGVNHTINQLGHINIPVMLMPDDFKSYTKIRIDNYQFNKENMPSHFKVKEYCPLVFRNLRDRFSISDHDFLHSLTRSEPRPAESPGKSSSVRSYVSCDKLYIIKSMTGEEVELMHHFLKQYHPYIVERHGKTLLPQYLAMYRVTVDNLEHYLVVMRNVFSNHLPVHKKFDLKGSRVDRGASTKELLKDLPTLKDSDFVKEGTKVTIGELAKHKLMETLTADVEFLAGLQLTDYSLLLGVHDVEQYEQDLLQQQQRADGVDGEERNRRCDGTEEDDYEDDEEEEEVVDSCGSGPTHQPTPPESPRHSTPPVQPALPVQQQHQIDPLKDIYAIPSNDGNERSRYIYFLAIIDVLTHYGVKKQAAKAAKIVKYGSSNAENISTVGPEIYSRRFMEFMQQVIA